MAAQVSVKPEADRVTVEIAGKPFTTLFHGADTLKPYLHPLRAADGTIVSRQFPMEKAEGETRDHPHHQGVWFTHGDVNGFDFWENSRQNKDEGKVVVTKVTGQKNGKTSGSVSFEANWNAPDGKTLLKETRTMVFHDLGASRAIDFDITLTAGGEPVKFGDTKEGTFAVRIADAMTEKSKGGVMVNAAGAQSMRSVWGKPSPWVDYSGTLNGKELGIAIFDHPSNPKHPSHWHSRDYGLFAANIFGERDFYSDKTRDGSVTLAPGKSMRFRYRLLVHPGLTASAKLASLYDEYKKTK